MEEEGIINRDWYLTDVQAAVAIYSKSPPSFASNTAYGGIPSIKNVTAKPDAKWHTKGSHVEQRRRELANQILTDALWATFPSEVLVVGISGS